MKVKKVKDVDAYADFTATTWQRTLNPIDPDITVCGFGLAGECGEVMEILKKFARDGHFDLANFTKEMGDAIYYWARLCRMFNLDPSEVLAANVTKLKDRQMRGVLRGSGDNR